MVEQIEAVQGGDKSEEARIFIHYAYSFCYFGLILGLV